MRITLGFCHRYATLLTTLAAPDVDDDVRVGVLGERLRDDSLAATEGAGDGCGTTLHAAAKEGQVSYQWNTAHVIATCDLIAISNMFCNK